MERKPTKISIIGAGAVGAACAFSIATQRLCAEIVIIDVNKEKAEGEAMDISHGLITMGTMNICSGDYSDIVDSDLIVITAGVGRKPGETRLDLANKNISIARDVTANIMKYYNGGAIMVVSNPVDVITYLIQKESGLPHGRVFGTGTVLDSARFRYFLSTKIDADIRNIHGYTAGEHGDAQFAVWSSVHVSGMRLDSFCQKKGLALDKNEVMNETISSGAQVIKRKGVTNYAIAAIVAELAATVLKNRRSIFSVTSLLDDYYGISDVAISVPSFVGDEGVVGKLMYDFTQEEMENLQNTAKKMRAFLDSLKI
ncbi:MAG TPA: L-lactate dehydrogenase [Candidatus Gallimonas intestinigallinarum]|uniref:L-lactate dehydrogenase n=1 Tax=Candidatus Gallimonas intestinigallinarum TaxID=2838604 RepID=A0A9D2DYI9_9FIRM|nr:L-lactate dehydrogenase [Candidatus Gallimonas intestinigallinarum]